MGLWLARDHSFRTRKAVNCYAMRPFTAGISTVMTSHRDTLYSKTLGDPGLFTFNSAVVSVFPDMIKRSVPGYGSVIAMTGLLAARHARPGTRIYDLGCSLGASLLSCAEHAETEHCELVGLDNSNAMLRQCRANLVEAIPQRAVTLIEADITTVDYQNASVCILNYTLQFVPIAQRLSLLRKLRAALSPGDILILSEKLLLEPEAMDALMVKLHHDFKRAQGYSDLEIANKRQALENVLLPETRDTHKTRLLEAGFSHADVWFQCFNFASLVAVA